MFVTANQLYVFLACVAFGTAVGVLLSFSMLLNCVIKKLWIKSIFDVVILSLAVFIFVWYSFSLNFPSLRFYMLVGVALGIVGYCKSYHIILAKMGKMAYNKIRIYKGKLVRCRKKNKKGL